MNTPFADSSSALAWRLSQRRMLAFVVLLVLVALAALAWKVFDDRQKERTIASGALQLQSQTLSSVLHAAFGSAEQTLLNLAEQLQWPGAARPVCGGRHHRLLDDGADSDGYRHLGGQPGVGIHLGRGGTMRPDFVNG